MSTPPAFRIPPAAGPQSPAPAWPLWTVYVAGVLIGAALVAAALVPALDETPTLAAASVIAFGSFGVVCAWLLNRITYFRRVPARTTARALLWGALAAAGFSVVANNAIYGHFAETGEGSRALSFTPFTEEPAKTIGVVLVLLLATARPRTALDGLVVGAFVGLGFEVVENVVQSINNAIASFPPGQRDNLGSLATDVIHEVVRRSWTGHIVITGIAGFGIGYALTARHRSSAYRWTVALSLVSVAVAGHVLWNSHRFGIFYVIGQFGLLALLLWLIRIGRAQERALYLPFLGYAEPGLLEGTGRGAKRARADLAVAIATGDGQRAQQAVAALADGRHD